MGTAQQTATQTYTISQNNEHPNWDVFPPAAAGARDLSHSGKDVGRPGTSAQLGEDSTGQSTIISYRDRFFQESPFSSAT